MKLNKNTTLVIFLIALFIQLIIITYNHITGYIEITGTGNFLTRLIIGISFSFAFGLLIVWLDLLIINILDNKFPLPKKMASRIPAEIFMAVAAGTVIGSSVTLTAGTIMPYEDGLIKNVINNSLITSVINLLIITGIEALVWFRRGEKSAAKSEKLEKENSEIKFETLKSQLNPHFLFNSLNVLSTLIKKDSNKAQDFVDEFSFVYRYTLDVIEKPLVELREELEYAKSFIYLQKIRFNDSIISHNSIDATKLSYLIPPLAVQTLLENAFKHNKTSVENPLCIKIYTEDNLLVVANNIQPKLKQEYSTGVGLNNLKKRYELLGERAPEFTVTDNDYIAKLPLIMPD